MRRTWAGLWPRGFSARVRGVALLLRRPWHLYRRLGEIRLLRTSDLFDVIFYRSQYPDVARSGIDPVTHYVVVGALEGLKPGPLFDSRFYLDRNPDVARARLNPLAHYLRRGAAEGQSPNPLFDSSFYLDQYPDVARSGLAPLRHYVGWGAKEGRNPHPLFDTSFYLRQYPDVARSGLNPLVHYLQYGAKERRNPHPLFDASYYVASRGDLGESNPLVDYIDHGADDGRDPSPLFDTAYYRETYGQVWPQDRSPLEHYVRTGSGEGHSPHPLFDPSFYRTRYADVAESGLDPLDHFLRDGARERRDPNPLFDTSFYLERYPDVDAAGLNALDHYCRFGCREGRDAGPLFRTSLYLEENPTVRASGVNALAHFLRSLPKGQDPRDTPFAFRSWLASYDTAGESDPATMRSRIGRLAWRPIVSLIVAVRDSVEWSVLEATIESLRSQLYEAWELLVLLPPSVQPSARDRLEQLRAEDRRIRVLTGGTSEQWAMLNDGLASASGDFVAFVGDDDVLDERALFLLAEVLGGQPDAAVVYSDEDRMDHQGRRHHPHFKPDWNRDLFLGWNYLGRLVFLARQVVEEVGGLRGTFTPSHEYDLLLRVIGEAGDGRVRHIPWILCHRRASGAPRAGADSAEEAASAARALEDHLARSGTRAVVQPVRDRFHRVLYPLPEEWPLASILVTVGDRPDRLQQCLSTLLEKTDYPSFEILVAASDRSDPETSTYLRSLEPPCRVLRFRGDLDYPAVVNLAVGQAAGTVVVLLKSDTEVLNPSWLTEMVRLSLASRRRRRRRQGLQPGRNHPARGDGDGTRRFGGARVRRSFEKRGGLLRPRGADARVLSRDGRLPGNEAFGVRGSRRVRPGGLPGELQRHRSLSARPGSRLEGPLLLSGRAGGSRIHGSRRDGRPRRPASEFDRFRARWMHVIRNDPFYNPNLSIDAGTFSLALPPRPRGPRDESTPDPVAKAVSLLDPYAAVDNWKRAAEVQNAPRTAAASGREWRPGLSIVILTLDRFELIAPLLDQLVAARQPLAGPGAWRLQIIVGDTGSTDERVLRKYEDLSGEIVVERDLQYHFSRCNNRLFLQRVALDKTLFLNNDIILWDPTDSLMALARQIDEDPCVGIAGAALTYPDGRVQHVGIDFYRAGPLRGLPFHPHHGDSPAVLEGFAEARDCRAVTGACLVIRSRPLRRLGGLRRGIPDRMPGRGSLPCGVATGVPVPPGPRRTNRPSRERDAAQGLGRLGRPPAYRASVDLVRGGGGLLSGVAFLAARMQRGWGVSVVAAEVGGRLGQLRVPVVVGCTEHDGGFDDLLVRSIAPEPASVARLAEQQGCGTIVALTSPFFEALPSLAGRFRCWAWEWGDPTPEFFVADRDLRAAIIANKRRTVYPAIAGVIVGSNFLRSEVGWNDCQVVYPGADHAPDMGPKTLAAGRSRSRSLRVGTLMRLGSGEARVQGQQPLSRDQDRQRSRRASTASSWLPAGAPKSMPSRFVRRAWTYGSA